MEIAHFLIDFILHVDQHLAHFVQAYGSWVYVVLFAVVFVETGLVVMPFLPGDSLLFVTGALCGLGLLNLPASMVLLFVAAVLGDQLNYTIGRHLGPQVFQWENSRFFNKAAFNSAHAFYEKHGGITVIVARFLPFVRTFAPFVAGVSEMSRAKFTLYNIVGALIWVMGLVLVGYFCGNMPWVQKHLEKIIWALILIPALLAALGAWRAKRQATVEAG